MSRRRLVGTGVAAVGIAVVVHVAAQFLPVALRAGWSISAFRDFYSFDQLSYLAIAANAAQGEFGAVEPFTETGSIFYPRAYYLAIGAVAHVLGIPAPAAWALLGLAMQVLLVATLGVLCAVLARNPWAALTAPLPFFLGTFSLLTSDHWFTQLDSHAVLWGPFAVLFPLNAEAAGLCVGTIALGLLLLSAVRLTGRRRVLAVAAAGLLVGLLANLQTYSFFATLYVVAYAIALAAIATSARRVLLGALTAVALAAALVVGPLVSAGGSGLAVMALGLLPSLIGLIVAARRHPLVATVAVAGTAVAASPSVLATALGLLGGDDFLRYRVASSLDLGVPPVAGLIAAAPMLVLMAVVVSAAVAARMPFLAGAPVGLVLAGGLLASNDRWGANQEPYRLWIDCVFFAAVSAPLLLAVVLPAAHRRLADDGRLARLTATRGRRTASAVVVIALLAVPALAAADWVRFQREISAQLGFVAFGGERDAAIARAALAADGGLVLTDPCVDPVHLKIASGAPVVYMNRGMAWPADYDAVDALLVARASGNLAVAAAHEAGVAWVVTDPSCDADWDERYAELLTDAQVFEFSAAGSAGSVELWRFPTTRDRPGTGG